MKFQNLNPIRKIKELGLSKFVTVWAGQSISIIGSSMSHYAMTFWVWNETGTATSMVLMQFMRAIPAIVLMPIAGSIVDRFNRKTVVMLADTGAAIMTAFIMTMMLSKSMNITFVYVAAFFEAVFNTFHWLANDAMKIQIVPSSQLGRISGMRMFSGSLSGIIAPLLAAGLVATIGYAGVFAIDLVTFAAAIISISFVKVPTLPRDESRPNNVFKDALFGFRYFMNNKTLLWMTIINIFAGVTFQFGALIVTPMILARTSGNTMAVGIADAWMSVASLIGSLVLMFWGGPKKRYLASLFFYVGFSVGLIVVGLGKNIVAWSIGGFIWLMFGSLSMISDAFFSSKIPAAMQGRVFGAMILGSELLAPLSFGFAGVLADKVFEPMMANPEIASRFAWLVGTGKGSGMSLLIVIAGILSLLFTSTAFLVRHVREADTLLPDANEALV
jgi:MFS family permease